MWNICFLCLSFFISSAFQPLYHGDQQYDDIDDDQELDINSWKSKVI